MKRILAIGLVLVALPFCRGEQALPAGSGFDGEIRILYQFARRPPSFTPYVLLPDGRIYEGMPQEGLAGFDFAKLQKANPKFCGTYVQKGGKMKITWGGRPAETWDHEKMANGDESMEGAMWLKGVPIAANQKLDGKYVWSSSIKGGAAAGTLTFRPDGTFTDTASALVWFVDEKSGKKISGGATKETSGTYKIDGFSMTLEGNGNKTTKSIMVIGAKQDPASPTLLFLDGNNLLRLKK